MNNFCVLTLAIAVICSPTVAGQAQDSAVEAPRIESVVMSPSQPHASDPAVIWYDDFDQDQRQEAYPEKSGRTTGQVCFGDSGKSLEMYYAKGSRGTGGRKLFFGDSPTYRSQVQRGDDVFDDVYWRIYVKHPIDWRGGGPAKLSRATSLVPPGWRQAMIAHVWSSGDALTLDPATGVQGDRVVTTRYNDFPNLNWLGNRPASRFQLHGSEGAGWWVCVEARAKLNTPGESDGINQLWIDGRLEAERTHLNWRGSFEQCGINAVFLEAYWNEGSPVDQSRWIDNFIVSTEPIGPVVCPRNPALLRTPRSDPSSPLPWQVELASDSNGQEIVWRSADLASPQRVVVDHESGEFTGVLAGEDALTSGQVFYCRIRQRSHEGMWSEWSPWHQPFRTTSASDGM